MSRTTHPPAPPLAPARSPSLETLCVRGGRRPDPGTGALHAPPCQSTAFHEPLLGAPPEHAYSRVSNPSVAALEDALGALESATTTCFASGMAALTALALAFADSGAEVLCSWPTYGGTERLLRQVLGPFGVTTRFADLADPEALDRHVTSRTRLVLVETPANPTLRLVDLAATAERCDALGVPLAVDNTFLTPLVQRPLDLGATVTVLSTTKYVEGHGLAVGGAVATRDAELAARLRFLRKSVGFIQSPFDAWLTLRGLTTLPQRLERQFRSASLVARALDGDARLLRVLHPSLPGFAQAELARRQHGEGTDRHGGIVSIEVPGGRAAAQRLVDRLTLFTPAENVGAAESLVTHAATMTHGDVPVADREAAGITEGLLRLSIGLESPDDLVADLRQALASAEIG